MIVLTENDASLWKQNVPKTIVIPNCVTIYPNEQSKLKNKKVISVGRIEPQKGFDLLIKAWEIVSSKHPDWILDIYGNGGYKVQLEKEINQRKLTECIKLNDAVPDIYNKYMESSIYVMSSRYEGFGLVLIEAMSCGVPCISFNCPYGPSEIITHNQNGLLVENFDIDKLAEGICYLIENENIRLSMGKEAKKSVIKYLPQYIMPQWEKLFNDLSANK